MKMKIDLTGRIRNTKLAYRNCLMPVFEAIINSFQSIEDKGHIGKGVVRVTLRRRKQMNIETGDYAGEPIEAFEIEDNGIGFREDNFNAFMTADTLNKKERGGKGIGRFMWLKAFNVVHIDSWFKEREVIWRRTFDFSFSSDGVEKHNKKKIDSDSIIELITRIELDGFKEGFQEQCPKNASIIARRIIEHFLEYFLFENAPKVFLIDDADDDIYNLNEIFEEEFKPEFEVKKFKIGNESFNIQDVLIKKAHEYKHQVHFCAHRRVVTSEALSSKIAHLETEIMPQSWPAQSKKGFWDLSASKKSQRVLFSKPIVLAGGKIA